ncbi:MAG: DUF4783 domain-containing protein [Bacteroidetes bacterium]|nr:DUF4783 domain-containing protein [Bacteroidota bacterium]
MKSLSIILIILLSGIPGALNLYQAGDIKQEVAAAIRSGDAARLSGYFDKTVNITLPSVEGTYSKSQAELILKDFFAKNPPVSFVIDHEGASDSGSQYFIGTYKSASSTFRAYILIKKLSGTLYLQQLQFDAE